MTMSPTGETGGREPLQRDPALAPAIPAGVDQVRGWRHVFYAFAGVVVASLAISGAGRIDNWMAYIGAAGMLVAVVGMVGVLDFARGLPSPSRSRPPGGP